MTVIETFRDAVNLIKTLAVSNIRAGELFFPSMSPLEVFLELGLQIKCEDGTYDVSINQARQLCILAETERGAFDLVSRICAVNIERRKEIPDEFRLFNAMVMTRLIDRPASNKRDLTWMSNLYKLAMIRFVAKQFDLRVTRGDNNAAQSACDVVAFALSELGVEVNYERLKKFCVAQRYTTLREEADRWFILLQDMGPDWSVVYPVPECLAPYVPFDMTKGHTPEGS